MGDELRHEVDGGGDPEDADEEEQLRPPRNPRVARQTAEQRQQVGHQGRQFGRGGPPARDRKQADPDDPYGHGNRAGDKERPHGRSPTGLNRTVRSTALTASLQTLQRSPARLGGPTSPLETAADSARILSCALSRIDGRGGRS